MRILDKERTAGLSARKVIQSSLGIAVFGGGLVMMSAPALAGTESQASMRHAEALAGKTVVRLPGRDDDDNGLALATALATGGEEGPEGPRGPRGFQGPIGPVGPAGPAVTPTTVTSGPVACPASGVAICAVTTAACPAGTTPVLGTISGTVPVSLVVTGVVTAGLTLSAQVLTPVAQTVTVTAQCV